MIPLSMKAAWARMREAEQEEEIADVATEPPKHDLVLRYSIIGIFVLLLLASLSAAKTVMAPLTAGLVFGMVLGPLVDRLIRLGFPQGGAAALVVLVGVTVMALVVGIFAAPFAIWSDQLPTIIDTLKERFSELLAMAKQVEGATKDLTSTQAVPKVAVETGSPLVDIAVTSSAAAGGVLIFVATIYFYLATRRHMKARALRLCLGTSARRTAGQFLEDVENRLAAYFAVVTIINLAIGLITTAIAWWAGLPFPPFWGLMAFILNYIAFVGPIMMAGLLLGAALLDKTGNWTAIWPAAAYYAVHLIEGNVVTPLLVGRRLTLSPFLVFISFVFWLWLWGPVGAILSVPLLILGALSLEAGAAYRQLAKEQAETAHPSAADPVHPPLSIATPAGTAGSGQDPPSAGAHMQTEPGEAPVALQPAV
jgi:predicted PurR-regulated permease PerM